MTLKVGPVTYNVFAGRPDDGDAMGQCLYKSARIAINPDYQPDHQRSTLFHEAIHAVDQVYGIGLTETQVRAIEVGVLALIDDNPALLAFTGV